LTGVLDVIDEEIDWVEPSKAMNLGPSGYYITSKPEGLLHRMLRDSVLDAVEGKNVLEALCERADALLRRQR
jgi:hypothetical protein